MKWIIVGIVAILVGVVVWFRPQRMIGVSPTSVSVPRNGTTPLTVQLLYKGWFTNTFKPIHGTITISVPQSLGTANPVTVNTNPTGGRSGTSAITGIAEGTGQIILNGTSRNGTHDTLRISLRVTGAE